ncbi:MAG TPA: CvpA family protein [Chloroflexota bacterium]|nr:CvpA family protein [Chloroflexota bacterium]
MSAVNTVDIIIAVCMVTGMAAGFRQGLLRQAIDVAALYVAVVLAAQYYGLVSAALAPSLGLDQTTLASLTMFGIFVLAYASLHGMSYLIYPHTSLTQLAIFDRVGGAGLGLAVGTTIIGVGLTLLVFILQAPWGMNYSNQQVMVSLIGSSRLDTVIQSVLPSFFNTLRPWLPNGLPAILGYALNG